MGVTRNIICILITFLLYNHPTINIETGSNLDLDMSNRPLILFMTSWSQPKFSDMVYSFTSFHKILNSQLVKDKCANFLPSFSVVCIKRQVDLPGRVWAVTQSRRVRTFNYSCVYNRINKRMTSKRLNQKCLSIFSGFRDLNAEVCHALHR